MSHRLFKSTSIVAGMTLLSRLLGFVRDVVMAEIFGAGAEFDAYVIAFKLPNFLRRLFAEGAFSQAFVPILSELRAKRPEEEVREFVNRIAGTLGLIVLLVVVLAEIIAPLIIMVFAPGFFLKDPMRYQLATHMLRITFPYLLLITLTAFCGAILNTFNRFAIPAFTPVLLNISLILVAWLWAPHATQPIYVLAWGVLIGGLAQLLLQLPSLRRLNLLPIPKPGLRDQTVRRVMKLMVPALFGVSVAQISLLIDNFFASFLPAGSISWLYYSDRLTYLPLGVIGVALATVVMPQLSRQHANDSTEQFSATLDWALRIVLIIGTPAAIGLLMLAGPLLATLFYHGEFNVTDVIMTRKSLMAFSIGLPGFMLIKVLASAFYSRQNIRTPVKVAAVAVGANIILNLILIGPLAHAGLALATSLASLLDAIVLWRLLLTQKIYVPKPHWRVLMLRIVVANVVMAILLWQLAGPLNRWLIWTIGQRSWHLAGIIVLAVIVYVVVLMLSGLRFRHLKAPTGI